MIKNNWYFQEHIIYNFEDVLIELFSDNEAPYSQAQFRTLLQHLNYLPAQSLTNVYGLSFLELNEYVYVPTTTSVTLLNKLADRYGEHYCIDILDDNEKEKAFKSLMKKVVKLMDYTYPKYSTLLDQYENQKTHLMDKLSRVRQGERNTLQDGASSNNGSYKDLHNDTPQTTDVTANLVENQYVSDLNKGENSASGETHQRGNDTFNETETHDPATIIERLNEIQNKFAQVWRKWLDEFEQLFIEEVNF